MKRARLALASLLTIVLGLFSAIPAAAQTAPIISADFAVGGGRFFAQANGGASNTGFAVTDEGGVPMWTWFQRYGGSGQLGFPNTGRFLLDGFNVQGTQRVLLQWQPGPGAMMFVNIFDRMHDAGLDTQLQNQFQIPPQIDNSAAEKGLTFDQIRAIRESWLEFPNPAFKNQYFSDPSHIDHFGLPTSKITDFGPFLAIRLQRVAFQLWKIDGPAGIKAGQLVLALGSDVAKALNFYPKEASTPTAAPVKSVPGAASRDGLQFGFVAHGINNQAAAAIAGIQDAGFKWMRQQVRWCDFQPNAGQAPIWGDLDALASDAAAGGIRVLFSVVCAPAWAAVPNGAYPKNPADLAAFMSAMANQFKGRVQAYEIWNEANFAREVGPGNINAGSYVELLRAVYPAIKAADPGALVISGAPTPTGVNDPNVAQDDLVFLSNMYAYQDGVVKGFFDVLGAHPQGYGNAPEETVFKHSQSNFSNHPSFFFQRAEDYRNLMLQVGDGTKPIWATETGYDSNGVAPAGYEYARTITEAQQADYLIREFKLVRERWPWMGVMFVWNLNFQAVVPQGDEKWGFGVLRADYSPRPAYTALMSMPK